MFFVQAEFVLKILSNIYVQYRLTYIIYYILVQDRPFQSFYHYGSNSFALVLDVFPFTFIIRRPKEFKASTLIPVKEFTI